MRGPSRSGAEPPPAPAPVPAPSTSTSTWSPSPSLASEDRRGACESERECAAWIRRIRDASWASTFTSVSLLMLRWSSKLSALAVLIVPCGNIRLLSSEDTEYPRRRSASSLERRSSPASSSSASTLLSVLALNAPMRRTLSFLLRRRPRRPFSPCILRPRAFPPSARPSNSSSELNFAESSPSETFESLALKMSLLRRVSSLWFLRSRFRRATSSPRLLGLNVWSSS
mmetsp:Transcript_33707/g.81663  ORF Transcript_33707/g.81663 Transcript_33707/m.81663 type:complete len:228 (+) Transcript_33707:3-686(+)